ncbi:hypothetical protein LUZ60_007291 [Juncus effusus]|nr:hypothetical protein LUZ60_007291 [Juncus effusus]
MDQKMRPQRFVMDQGQRTSPIIWAVGIICTILSIGIIVSGVAVFTVYLIYKPKMPHLVVNEAHLNNLVYTQYGTLDVDMSVIILAENTNNKADASFSDVSLAVQFHGVDIARLQAYPFEVYRNNSQVLNYPVRSTPIPLDQFSKAEMEKELNKGVVQFGIYGKARTRWRVGIFISVKFWTRLSCHLQFFISNGTAVARDCSSHY